MQRNTPATAARVRANLTSLRIRPYDEPSPVYAYVNHGRWVADCPSCNGAELVSENQEFLCGTCGRVSPAVWPDTVTQIEATLNQRPEPNRNWNPGETVGMLTAENFENGVG